MLQTKKFTFIPIGFAIFSMFFGAGNSVFPLVIGTYAKDKNIYAILGMSITAIFIPLMGLISMILYDGDYKTFFSRLGKLPGFFVILLIMVLIGPFAGIPRCVTLSYGTLQPYLGKIPLFTFCIISCGIIFLATMKKRRLLDILGRILTPIMLFCLAVIIVKGFYGSHEMQAQELSSGSVFYKGLTEGYQMMDLLASFFFASVVLACLKLSKQEVKSQTKLMLKSSVISVILLGIIYVGFSFVAAFNSSHFSHLSQDALLGAVGLHILGHHAGFIMSLAISLACITTAIALVSVFSDYLHSEIFKEKIDFKSCIVVTLLITFLMSNLGFSGICKLIAPVLAICYPSLIALSIVNILYKLYDFKPVKLPVYSVFALSLILTFIK